MEAYTGTWELVKEESTGVEEFIEAYGEGEKDVDTDMSEQIAVFTCVVVVVEYQDVKCCRYVTCGKDSCKNFTKSQSVPAC